MLLHALTHSPLHPLTVTHFTQTRPPEGNIICILMKHLKQETCKNKTIKEKLSDSTLIVLHDFSF